MSTKIEGVNGVWRTIGGRRVFIKDGQSLSEAMISSGKFKNLRSEYKKAKEEENKKERTTEQINKEYEELSKKMQQDDYYYKPEDDKKLKELRAEYDTKVAKGEKDVNEPSIHTQSGSYTPNELKNRDESIKQMYKDAWEGKKSYKELNDELEGLKKDGKVSQGELDALKYDASLETGDWQNNPKNAHNSEYIGDNKVRIKEESSAGDYFKKQEENALKAKDYSYGYSKDTLKNMSNEDLDKYIQKNEELTKEYANKYNNDLTYDQRKTRNRQDTIWDKGMKTKYEQQLKNAQEEKASRMEEVSSNKNWQEQIKANNAKMEKDVVDLQNKINEYRNKSIEYRDKDALKSYQYLKEADNLTNKYYERFRENERANAKIKVEEPNEKYMNVEAYAGYKEKFNKTWGTDGSGEKTVSAKMYTNDEFMEHLEDANWHSERKALLDANLTNKELSYIKDRTKVSAWGVENLTGKEQVEKLIKEAKSQNSSINNSLRQKAYQKYLKEHPSSKMTFEDFKDMRK